MSDARRNEATEATRVAIELLTLWIEPGDDARANAIAHITTVIHDPGEPRADSIIAGLLNLNMLTLFQLAKERGASGDEYYRIAGDILREISPQLPDAP